MKILIIGSSGFIGSYCYSYFNEAHDVWKCDIHNQHHDNHFFLVNEDSPNFNPIFQSHKFDLCINCSGAADVKSSFKDPVKDFKSNTLNIINILEAIRTHNPRCKFLTISSAAVYGNPPATPITTQCVSNPISPYGFHKSIAEEICKEYYKLWEIPSCCVRVFSTYGPGLKKQLLWDLYNKFTTGETVNLWGTGNETRDFIYITDLVRAIEITIHNSNFHADIINIANGKQISISKVAEVFAKELGADAPSIVFSGIERTGDPLNWEADIPELRKWGYRPNVSIEEGIRNYIQWAKKERL